MTYFIILIATAFLLYFIIINIQKKTRKMELTKLVNTPSVRVNIQLTTAQKLNSAKQLLESLYIIETTKNLDILLGRMDFINKVYDNFVLLSNTGFYHGRMVEAIDIYKSMYYDRTPTENQISLLIYPNTDNLNLFYSDCIVDCYERYVAYQAVEMNKLKTQSAKERRREDIIRKGDEAKESFKTYELPDNGHLENIENIRKHHYSQYHTRITISHTPI